MTTLRQRYLNLMHEGIDISEHLGLLCGLAMDPDVQHITEFGFRTGVSATALCMAGKPVVSYDVEPCAKHVAVMTRLAPKFIFKQQSSTALPIASTDLLFIDSLHTYKQLRSELMLQSVRVSKWIAIHDTATFALMGKDGTKPGLQDAMNFFLYEVPAWKVRLHLSNNNGLTLLERSTAQ
ncbi:MAG: class I SAM-dependent methyltransferase [bacterium]|nr:class I SAM-dependent methyltransferase [bacterium]